MRTLLRLLPMLALLAAPLQVFGGTQAVMQVSFTVVASCTVEAHGAAAPAVDCAKAAGFIVDHTPAFAPSTAGNSPAGWTVYF